MGMCSSAVVASRICLNVINGFPVGRCVGEDLEAWMKLACVGEIGYIPEVLAIYHDDPYGACNMMLADRNLYPAYRNFVREHTVRQEVRRSAIQFVSSLYLDNIEYYRMKRCWRRMINAVWGITCDMIIAQPRKTLIVVAKVILEAMGGRVLIRVLLMGRPDRLGA